MFRRFGVPCWAAADGSGDSGPVPNTTVNDYPSSPGPDPDSVITLRLSPETSGDVFLMSMSGAFEPKPLIVTPAYEGGAQLSPDGRWLLYQSDASGRAEIYVRRYPALDRQWQVSDGGGVQPRWSRNSREIYYRGGGHLVAATLDASRADPVFGKPTTLFADDYDFGAGRQHRELRRHARRPVHHDSEGHQWRQAARHHQLDRRAEADPRGGWNPLMTLGTSVRAPVTDALLPSAAQGR